MRRRADGQTAYPPLRAIFTRALTVSPRPYWRFGVANAIDKNLSSLFVQLPLQLVGIYSGARAVGYLQLALNGIGQAGIFTSAVLDNMQAVVPQAVGRGDFATLQRNYRRVLLVLAAGGVLLYGAVALFAPVVIPPVLGARWVPATAPLALLAVYGAVTTAGGVFGPLYRAFNLMRRIIVMRVITLALVLPAGTLLLTDASLQAAPPEFYGLNLLAAYNPASAQAGALIGAGMIDAMYVIAVTLTAALALPELRKKAQ
jgi:O-antigen/teichoic acid export membrane protein